MPLTKTGIAEGAGAIRRLAVETQKRVGELFAEYVRGELRKQHTSGRSLYGERYPKPKSGGVPMLDTGLLMDGYDVQVLDGGRRVKIGQHVYYSRFLQGDGEHEHLLDERGLPKRWQQKLDKIKVTEFRKLMLAVKAALSLKGRAPK